MSMNPGATTSAVASMTRSALSGSRGATATIRSPAIATSALPRAAPDPSITVPFLISSDQLMSGSRHIDLIDRFLFLSSPRKRGPITTGSGIWVPAFAGTTARVLIDRLNVASNPAWPRARISDREVRVHHAPVAAFLMEDHGRAREKRVALVVNLARRPVLADPIAVAIPVAPDDRHLVGDHAADVERGPIGALDVLLVERPQPAPVLGAVIGVAVQIIEGGLGKLAPDRLQLLPFDVPIGHDVVVKQLQELFPIAFGAAKQFCLAHSQVSLADLIPTAPIHNPSS